MIETCTPCNKSRRRGNLVKADQQRWSKTQFIATLMSFSFVQNAIHFFGETLKQETLF